jgi:hypothetical protein
VRTDDFEALTLGLDRGRPAFPGPPIGRVDLSRLTALEDLHIHGAAEIAPTELENLKSLSLFGRGATADRLLALSKWRCPRLESLSIFFGEAEPIEILSTLDRSFPALQQLRLAGARDPAATARALVEAPVTRMLETLALTDSSADSGSVAILAGAPDAFQKLSRLDLSGCALLEQDVRGLDALGCDVIAKPRSALGDIQLSCSFCGKSQREVRKLIAGPTVYICDECVGLCGDILEEERVKDP